MDKLQKQLVNTYFKKRFMSKYHDVSPEEIKYMIDNGFNMDNVLNKSIGLFLIRFPEYVNKVDSGRLNYSELMTLIQVHPKLIDQIERYTITGDILDNFIETFGSEEKKIDGSKFYQWALVECFKENRSLYRYVDLSNVNSFNLGQMIIDNPEILKVIDIKKLSIYVIIDILKSLPNLAEKLIPPIKEDLTMYQVRSMLSVQPELYKYFNFDDYSEDELSWLIFEIPILTPKLNLSKMSSFYIANFLRTHPEYVEYFDVSKMDSWDRDRLLLRYPDLRKYFE